MRCTDGQWLLIRLLSVSAQFYKYRWIPDDLKNWIVKKLAFYISLENGKWLVSYKKHKPLFTPPPTPNPHPTMPCKRRTSFARGVHELSKNIRSVLFGVYSKQSLYLSNSHRLGVYLPLCLCLSLTHPSTPQHTEAIRILTQTDMLLKRWGECHFGE